MYTIETPLLACTKRLHKMFSHDRNFFHVQVGDRFFTEVLLEFPGDKLDLILWRATGKTPGIDSNIPASIDRMVYQIPENHRRLMKK